VVEFAKVISEELVVMYITRIRSLSFSIIDPTTYEDGKSDSPKPQKY
jgi:hypothetical protein